MDTNKITNPKFDGVDTKDYPDFTDAYLVSGWYDGKKLTDDEIHDINDNYRGWVQEMVLIEVCGG